MDWRKEPTERRRAQSKSYAAAEALIEAEGGGFEIEIVTDGFGKPLATPILVAAGDAKSIFHLD